MKVCAFVHANSKNPRVEKRGEDLHIFVKAPAKEGKANTEALRTLADYFGINKSSAKIVKGAKSKQKLFNVIV